MRPRTIVASATAALAATAALLTVAQADGPSASGAPPATTPIKHVVVIFGENESFDHYFGTYPNAANPAGEPRFDPKASTPQVNGLSARLLTSNPNAANPTRLDRSQAVTCSQDHGYSSEQKAFDQGLMDQFVEHTAGGSCTDKSIVMDYYDGNTVTGLWNLAQHFSLSDNSWDTTFGPSTVGALNLISGQTHGATPASGVSGVENGTVIGDPDPALDDCGKGGVTMSGKNVGDLMNAHHVTWGWFEGGFKPTSVDTATGKATCASKHANVAGAQVTDYSPHHEPFMYYRSTANPHHLPPSSPGMIGQSDQANHQYDLTDFDTALRGGDLPQVSFLKAAAFEDAHPSNSDPLDEQRFVARTLNELQQSPEWSSTAVVLAYDDSDGWYDHQMSPIVVPSAAPADALNGPGVCGHVKDATAYADRCGFGPRLPLMVISPWARQNWIDSSQTDQTSVTRFIEDNWQLGRIGDQSADAQAGPLSGMLDFDPRHARAPKLFLDPTTGLVAGRPAGGGASPTTGDGQAPGPSGGPDGRDDDPSGGDDGYHSGADGSSLPPYLDDTYDHRHARGRHPVDIALRCSAHARGRRLTYDCHATGEDAHRRQTVLRIRVVHGGHILATRRTQLRRGRATGHVTTRAALRKGHYTLRIAVSQVGRDPASVSRRVTL